MAMEIFVIAQHWDTFRYAIIDKVVMSLKGVPMVWCKQKGVTMLQFSLQHIF
jgi:hypothetical protein